jgi:hypothetical protein
MEDHSGETERQPEDPRVRFAATREELIARKKQFLALPLRRP